MCDGINSQKNLTTVINNVINGDIIYSRVQSQYSQQCLKICVRLQRKLLVIRYIASSDVTQWLGCIVSNVLNRKKNAWNKTADISRSAVWICL